VPFLRVKSESATHGSAQIVNWLGQNVKFDHTLTKVDLVSEKSATVDISKKVKLNEEQGIISINGLGYMSSGFYRLELTTESGLVLKSK
jgi:hypothetical protein